MAAVAANDGHLTIGGTNVSGYSTKCKIGAMADSQDTTAGFGTAWKSEAPGLLSASLEAEIVYDAGGVSSYVAKLQSGVVVRVIWGPNSNVAGRPKHEQDFHITSCEGPEVTVDKTKLSYSIKGNSVGPPITNQYTGGVF